MPDDDDTTSADPFTGGWWTRLRRAFSIPDLVGDAAAKDVIAAKVARQTESEHFDRMSVAKGLIWALLALGERGELDELFFDEVDREPLENIFQPYSPEERIRRAAIDQAGVRAPAGIGTAAEWETMSRYLIATFVDHVQGWPYEAAVAHYLPPDPPAEPSA